MTISRIIFLICFLFICFASVDAMAAAKKSGPAEPIPVLFDFNPFTTSNIVKGKVAYTVEFTIRVRANDTIEPTMREEIGKIRDSLLLIMRRHMQDKDVYTDVDFAVLKKEFENYFAKKYPDDFKKLYILKAYVK